MLPQTIEKCGFVPVNTEKAPEPRFWQCCGLSRPPGMFIVNLLKLQVSRFEDSGKEKPHGEKVPAGKCYSKPAEEEEEERKTALVK